MIFNVALCTRPADFDLILFCNSFDNLNPIIRSRILLVSCEETKSKSISLGCSKASTTAFFVISLKMTRFVGISFKSSTSFRCQLIASPSRSGSVAKNNSSMFLAASCNSLTTFFLSLMI